MVGMANETLNSYVEDGLISEVLYGIRGGKEAEVYLCRAAEDTGVEAGASVPKPYSCTHDSILMQYIGDESAPAQRLHNVTLEREGARALFEEIIRNIKIFLKHHIVHADLSAHNILYFDKKIWIIDFPQCIDPVLNSNGFSFLRRDVENICKYFKKYGLNIDANAIAQELWDGYFHHR
jgi:RIO kinase 1